MFELLNRDRSNPAYTAETGGQAAPLRWSAGLAAVARAHSEEMLKAGYFGHVDREGRSPGTRVKAAGIPWQTVGENIAGYGSVAGANAAFMREPAHEENHRAIILSRKYTEVGVGIVKAPDGSYYITEDFVGTPAESQTARTR
ncbi:MAG TPA: CAP domain-containing protein [Terriglobia bacterium]|nr:CAP domain-containing protein [Terriglobia bacterium]